MSEPTGKHLPSIVAALSLALEQKPCLEGMNCANRDGKISGRQFVRRSRKLWGALSEKLRDDLGERIQMSVFITRTARVDQSSYFDHWKTLNAGVEATTWHAAFDDWQFQQGGRIDRPPYLFRALLNLRQNHMDAGHSKVRNEVASILGDDINCAEVAQLARDLFCYLQRGCHWTQALTSGEIKFRFTPEGVLHET